MPSKRMISIPGSKKRPLANAQAIGPAPSDERLEVTVRIRPKNALPNRKDLLKISGQAVQQISHKQFEEQYGAGAKDLALLRKFARENNLNIVRESVARRSVILAGT